MFWRVRIKVICKYCFFIIFLVYKAPFVWGLTFEREERYQRQAQVKNLAFQQGWLRLGHYEKNILGHWHSNIRGDFFLAADGYQNPEAELQATLKAFFYPGKNNEAWQCRYLARRQWLKKNLNILESDLLPCAEVENWKQQLQAVGASLIFASADANSASSMYGHTFLKIIRHEQELEKDLLNYGVNYAAVATDPEGLVYALKGLFGFYKGGFTMQPYHEKLREYVNLEGRDIWEYRLDLIPEQLEQMLNHLLELKDSWSPYYFISDNCSSQLLKLIEVAKEDVDLSRDFYFFVIPLDAVKAVTRSPGLVKYKKHRASLKNNFIENYNLLNQKQRQTVKQIMYENNTQSLDFLKTEDQPEVLDTAMKFYALKSYQTGESFTEKKYQLLLKRSQLGLSDEKANPTLLSPDESHDSSGVYVGVGSVETMSFLSLKLRPAFHEMISQDESLFPFSQNEILSFDFRYYWQSTNFTLNRLTWIHLLTSRPIYDLEQPLSWKLHFFSEAGGQSYLNLGAGYSFHFLPSLAPTYKARSIGLLTLQTTQEGVGIGPDLFFIQRFKNWMALILNYRGTWMPQQYLNFWQAQLGFSLNLQTELILDFSQNPDRQRESHVRFLYQF